MSVHFETLVVGAGHAGVQLTANLAMQGYQGSLGILSNERIPPYERPPLSKELLTGAVKSAPHLRSKSYWAESSAELLLGRTVVSVDLASRNIMTSDGSVVGYDNLVWAAGGRARTLGLPGGDASNVTTIRNIDDVGRLRGFATSGCRSVVLGGGYVGLEVAASLTKRGVSVTVVETQDRILARATGRIVSRFYKSAHAQHGVDVILGTKVERVLLQDGMASSVRLSDGRILNADCIVVGIGMIPNTEALVAAGVGTADGIPVDEHCMTEIPGVYAIGDCAMQTNSFASSSLAVRIESIHNANHQSRVVAAHISGAPAVGRSVPWFWSHQYDIKLQTAGLLHGYDSYTVRGEPSSGRFTVVYTLGDRILAADCVNVPVDFAHSKVLIAAGARVDRVAAANPEIPLKSAVLA